MVTGVVLKRQLVLAVIVLVWPLSSALAQHDLSEFVHVRPTTPQLERLVDTGYRLSTIFRDVVDVLQGTSVIVHLVPGEALPPGLYGALHFITTASGYRYLRVDVRTNLEVTVLIAGTCARAAARVRDQPGAVGGRPHDPAGPLSTDRCQVLPELGSRVLRHAAGPPDR